MAFDIFPFGIFLCPFDGRRNAGTELGMKTMREIDEERSETVTSYDEGASHVKALQVKRLEVFRGGEVIRGWAIPVAKTNPSYPDPRKKKFTTKIPAGISPTEKKSSAEPFYSRIVGEGRKKKPDCQCVNPRPFKLNGKALEGNRGSGSPSGRFSGSGLFD